jgi:hypothetical protein
MRSLSSMYSAELVGYVRSEDCPMECRQLPELRVPVIYQVKYRGAPACDYGENMTKSSISLILQTNQNLLSPYIKRAA